MLKNINYKIVFFLLFVSSICGFTYNYFSGFGVDFIREKEELTWLSDEELEDLISVEDYSSETIKAIEIEQAYELYLNKNAVFVDARDQWEFADGHIKDAINIPEYMFEGEDAQLEKYDKNTILLVYCGDEDCGMSKKLATKLINQNFVNVFIFSGGWQIWSQNNYPTETSVLNE